MDWPRRPATLTRAVDGQGAERTWITLTDGPLDWCDPMDRPSKRRRPRIYLDIANIATPADAVGFATTWGLLVGAPNPIPHGDGEVKEGVMQIAGLTFPAKEPWWLDRPPDDAMDWRTAIARLRAAVAVALVVRHAPGEISERGLRMPFAALADAIVLLGGGRPSTWAQARDMAAKTLTEAAAETPMALTRPKEWVEFAGGRFVHRIDPTSVLAAAWRQLAEDLDFGCRWGVCARPGCGALFRHERDIQRWCRRCAGGRGRVERWRTSRRGVLSPTRNARFQLWPAAE